MNDPIADPPIPEDLRLRLELLALDNGFARARVFWGPQPDPDPPGRERLLMLEATVSCCAWKVLTPAAPSLLRAPDMTGRIHGALAGSLRRGLKRACTAQGTPGCAAYRYGGRRVLH